MPSFNFDASATQFGKRETFVSRPRDIAQEIEQWRGILERLLIEHTGLVTVRRRAPQSFTNEMASRLQKLDTAREKAAKLLTGYLDRFLPVGVLDGRLQTSREWTPAAAPERLREPSSTSSEPPPPPPSPLELDDSSTKPEDIRMEAPSSGVFEFPSGQKYEEYKAEVKSDRPRMEALLHKETERAQNLPGGPGGGFCFGAGAAPPVVVKDA